MKKWFCHTEVGLPVTIKIAISTAGYMIKKNNPEQVARIMPVVKGIQETIENGVDNEFLNSLIAEGLVQLVKHISADPIIMAAVNVALAQLKIDIQGEIAKVPKLTNEVIKDMIDSFIAGLETPIQ